jgi:protein required for attachment to host cells
MKSFRFIDIYGRRKSDRNRARRQLESSHFIKNKEHFRQFSDRIFISVYYIYLCEDNMDATWIVSANASRARFFSQAHALDSLEEINDMVNDAVRLRTSETESDKIGPTSATKSIHNTGGAAPNKNYEPHRTPVEHQTELFARSVASFLQQGHQEGRYKHLSLIASPQFLGELRKFIDPKLGSLVNLEIDKDYTQFSAKQLNERIHAHEAKG